MKQRELMLLLIPSFIMVAAWVIFNIYHSSVSSTISENLNMQITPINPTFDTREINTIKKRTLVDPIYEFQGATLDTEPVQVATPSPTVSPTPIASISPTAAPSQASSSGGISQ